MNISYFYTKDIKESVALKKSIQELPILNRFNVKFIDSDCVQFTQLEFLMACHRDDVVIVDCTIPEYHDKGQLAKVKSVYPILVAQINMLDHVLVVSNNMLPLNITPQRKGFDSPRLQSGFTKAKQIEWIEEQLTDLYNLISTGKHYPRINLSSYSDLTRHRFDMEQMWDESAKLQTIKDNGRKKVLISYRNCHFDEVKAFKDNYQEKHPEEIVRMVEPGVLCTGEETLTPMRKWMMVFMLEEYIHDVDELVIYKTDDYTDSWWTCAELIMVAYNNYGRTENAKIKIKYYDIYKGELLEITENCWLHLPCDDRTHNVLSEGQKNRLARLAANTRPDTMGPECMANFEKMKMICESFNSSNVIVRAFMRWSIKQMLKKSIPTSLSKEEKEDIMNKTLRLYTNKEELNLYLKDEVFDDNFWNTLSYQTIWPASAFQKNMDGTISINIDNFLDAPMNELINLSLEEIRHLSEYSLPFVIKTKESTRKYVAKDMDDSRYLWLATRMGQPTIKDGNVPGLERIPIYSIEPYLEVSSTKM